MKIKIEKEFEFYVGEGIYAKGESPLESGYDHSKVPFGDFTDQELSQLCDEFKEAIMQKAFEQRVKKEASQLNN